jgi:hypothetical protein
MNSLIARRKEADKRAGIAHAVVCSASVEHQIVYPGLFLSAFLLCTLPLGRAECGLTTG